MTNESVREAYDQIAERYLSARDQFASTPYLDLLTERLRPGSTVLDVGCGAGAPIDQYLIEHGYRVIGLDISAQQIALARAYVPRASYQVQDLSALRSGEYRVDAVVSFYAIFHTRRETHLDTFRAFHSFLPAGGLLLITMGSSDWEGVEADFHGARMYWSHYDSAANSRLIEGAGFVILHDVIDTARDERHQVILAELRSVDL
ncbi:MAG: SAM-dependent methyltransferase [Dehalococcoidia bacterium]